MKTTGIIAEYNPFHNGHLYQIQEARRISGADYVIVVMSPDFVQRGEPSLLDKWTRARMALDHGADLVLELPVRFASGSAEYFANGAVSLLSSLGVTDSLSFGCESVKIGPLLSYAQFLSEPEPEEYRSLLQDALRSGISYADARCTSYLTCTGREDPDGLLRSPNNILAVEYMKAIFKTGSGMDIIPVKRIGAGYHDTVADNTLAVTGSIPDGSTQAMYASASGIRAALSKGQDIQNLMPPAALKLLKEEMSLKRFLVPSDLDLPLHLSLYEKKSSLTDYADVSEDLANRIERHLPQYLGFDQFTELIKTKQIAYTRVRRALLHIFLGLKKEALLCPVSCARVLGFRKSATPLLHEIKAHTKIPLITKLPPAAPTDSHDQAIKSLEEDLRAAQLWEMIVSHKTGAPVRNERQRRIINI